MAPDHARPDEDREGESISWHVVEALKPKIPVRRIVFHEITDEAIHEALRQPRPIDIGVHLEDLVEPGHLQQLRRHPLDSGDTDLAAVGLHALVQPHEDRHPVRQRKGDQKNQT